MEIPEEIDGDHKGSEKFSAGSSAQRKTKTEQKGLKETHLFQTLCCTRVENEFIRQREICASNEVRK